MASPARPPSPAKRSSKRPAEVQPAGGTVLEDIYGERGDDQSATSLKQIDQRKERRATKILLWIFFTLFFVVVASVSGFYVFNRQKHFNEKGVTVTLDSIGNVPSGGETTLSFTVKNGESVGIRNVEFSLSPPDGWTFKRSNPNPADASNSLWRLGSVAAGGTTTFQLTGSIVGEVGSVKTFNATVTYRPTNFNYNFSSQTSGSVTIGSSILDVELTGPTQVTPKATTMYTLNYTNSSDSALSGIKFTVTYPDGFTPTTASPKAREGNNVWLIDELKSGAKGKIDITGTFSAGAGTSLELSFVGELRRGANYEKQVESSLVILVTDSTLSLDLTANKQKDASVAKPGDTVAYVLTYKNKSDIELSNVSVTVALSGGGLDTSSFADDDGATFKAGQVTWDQKLIPQLATVKPNTFGVIRFSVKAATSSIATKGAGGPTIGAAVTATVDGNQSAKLDSLVTKIMTVATLVIDPRYYKDDGTQLGSGPLPPVVGQTTTYRVFWRMTNTTTDLTNLTVQATVPSSVYWTGKNVSTTAGSIAFDTASRVVTWTLNRLPAGVGISSTPVSAGFDLSITPTTSDAGTMPTLLEIQTLKATDSFSGVSIEVKHDPVTTDLPNDPKAAGKGAVLAT